MQLFTAELTDEGSYCWPSAARISPPGPLLLHFTNRNNCASTSWVYLKEISWTQMLRFFAQPVSLELSLLWAKEDKLYCFLQDDLCVDCVFCSVYILCLTVTLCR